MDLNLSNKNALVCGSTQGIGKATAIELAKLGANITLVARNEESLQTVLKELDTLKIIKEKYKKHDSLLKIVIERVISDINKFPGEGKKLLNN